MHIAFRPISPDHPPYIIAEIGVNHDGDAARALELTRLAARAGADAVKLQLFEADRLMSRAAKLAAYQKAAGEQDPVGMLRRLELTIEEMAPVVALAHEQGIHAIVSVFSVELVEVAERLPWDAYKTASPDIINKPLLDALAATGKPLIVSTGASTLDEVERAVGWLRPARERLALLQCVSSYPTPVEHVALGGIAALRGVFEGPIGYSDHTEGDSTGMDAVLAGACILEKHFTDSRDAPGPDHRASLEPADFAAYILHARHGPELANVPTEYVPDFLREAMRLALTPAHPLVVEKRVLPIEQDVRTVSRQSLTTARPLPAGHVIARDDLTIKRPGTGIPPYELERTVGRVTARPIEGDMPIVAADLA